MRKQLHFSPHFQEKYVSEEFDYKEQVINTSAWDNFVSWLSRLIQKIFNLNPLDVNAQDVNLWLKFIAFILIGIVLFLLIKSLVKGEGVGFFKRAAKKISYQTEAIENIHSVNFETLIQEALAANDTRLCIRYHYLWLLKYYSDKNIIVWNHQKTNRDYYYEIQSKEHKQQFEKLSYLYNHIWYGDFEISDAVFQQARTAFLHIVKPNHHG